MTRSWVGMVAILMMLAMVGTGVSTPHPDHRREEFLDPVPSEWLLVRGNMSFEQRYGPAGDLLSWLVVEDDNVTGTGPSRVIADPTHTTGGKPSWNTTSASYAIEAILERDHTYVPPAIETDEDPEDNSTLPDNTTAVTDTWGDFNLTLDADVTFGFAPLLVNFTLTSGLANATALNWTFYAGEDANATASGTGFPNATSHTYTTPGLYVAELIVIDGNETGGASIEITVQAPPPPPPPTPPAPPSLLPGAIGLTFGEQQGGGYYVAAFTNERFMLGIPDSTTGEFTVIVNMTGWGNVPDRVRNVDDRHRYGVFIDGTTVTVKVNSARVGSFALPGIPIGTFGIIADEGTRVYSERLDWYPLDNQPPQIDLWRPAPGSLYVSDIPVSISQTGVPLVYGSITIGADITDDISGTKTASVYVDGRFVKQVVHPGIATTWTIPTSGLSPGYHTVKIRALDYAGFMAEESIEIFVLSSAPPTVKSVTDTKRMVEDRLPGLDDLPL